MPQLRLSKSAINEAITAFEVSWDKKIGYAVYNRKYKYPTVPAAATTASGVTIGLGFDCGHCTSAEIRSTWKSLLPTADVERLAACAGFQGLKAAAILHKVKDIVVPIEAALLVFYNTTLYKWAKIAYKTYPKIVNIHPVEQTVILGLLYNRGNSLEGDRRREMRLLFNEIANDNDKGMATLIRSMKRLWADVKGLRIRRDVEAAMIERLDTALPVDDLLIIDF